MKQINESWDAQTSRKLQAIEDIKKRKLANAMARMRYYQWKRKQIFGDGQ